MQNFDLWRLMHHAVLERGGRKERGLHQLNVVWQPSHQRASIGETGEFKHLRRGSDAANHFANLRRKIHVGVTKQVIATKANSSAVKN